MLLAGLAGNLSNLPGKCNAILEAGQQYCYAHGLSKEMAIHMPGLAARLYRQQGWDLRAELLGWIAGDVPSSLAGRTPAHLCTRLPA